jgi:hypothetical protein
MAKRRSAFVRQVKTDRIVQNHNQDLLACPYQCYTPYKGAALLRTKETARYTNITDTKNISLNALNMNHRSLLHTYNN